MVSRWHSDRSKQPINIHLVKGQQGSKSKLDMSKKFSREERKKNNFAIMSSHNMSSFLLPGCLYAGKDLSMAV